MDYLKGKSDEEIRRAATFWYMGADCYQRGIPVPSSVWLLSTKALTDSDIEWARELAIKYRDVWSVNPVDKG